jgi:hypothetical protein
VILIVVVMVPVRLQWIALLSVIISDKPSPNGVFNLLFDRHVLEINSSISSLQFGWQIFHVKILVIDGFMSFNFDFIVGLKSLAKLSRWRSLRIDMLQFFILDIF